MDIVPFFKRGKVSTGSKKSDTYIQPEIIYKEV